MVCFVVRPKALVFTLLLGAACQPEQPVTYSPGPAGPAAALTDQALSPLERAHAQLPGLVRAFEGHPGSGLLDSLDRVCCLADGELSTDCGTAALRLFELEPALLVGYWFDHPRSCLEAAWVDGYSEQWTTLSVDERRTHHATLRQAARALQVPVPQVAYLQKVVDRIDPSKYD